MAKFARGGVLFGLNLLGCLALTALLRSFFQDSPPPRFADPYLIGVLILAYKASVRYAVLLLAVSVGLSVYLLAPLDSFDFFELISFTLLALLLIWITRALRKNSTITPP